MLKGCRKSKKNTAEHFEMRVPLTFCLCLTKVAVYLGNHKQKQKNQKTLLTKTFSSVGLTHIVDNRNTPAGYIE